MSIILKGIDLPKNGEMYRINIYDNGNTYITTSNRWYETEMKDIEAIQISKPHGDLIDRDIVRDECYKTMEELMQSTTINISAEALSLLCGFTIINNTPTILEAEE